MICMGNISELKMRIERLVENNFPGKLTLPELLEATSEYELLLSNK